MESSVEQSNKEGAEKICLDSKVEVAKVNGENTQTPNKSTKISDKALYLGLQINEPIEKIHNLISNSLKTILEYYPKVQDALKLIEIIESNEFESKEHYKNPWKYPKDYKKWHVTSYFKKKAFNKAHPAYTSFEESKTVVIEIKAILYIPGKIITSVIFTDTPIENEFPHMTTLLGSYSAKHSNDVCKELFSKGAPLEKEYKELLKNELNEEAFVQKLDIKVMGKSETVYVVKLAEPLQFYTEMTIFYH